MRTHALVLIFAVAVPANAFSPWPQKVPASESEMELIRAEMGLDSVDEATRERILKIDGSRAFISEEIYGLIGELWLKPILAQDRLCILTRYEISAEPKDSGFEWYDEPFVSYRNWLADPVSGCEVNDPSDVDGALVTYEPIPSDSLVQILEGSNRLIAAVMSHPDLDEKFRDDQYNWTLSEVRLPFQIDLFLGFPYSAMLRSPGAQHGPTVTFSVHNGEFIIHSVGSWIV